MIIIYNALGIIFLGGGLLLAFVAAMMTDSHAVPCILLGLSSGAADLYYRFKLGKQKSPGAFTLSPKAGGHVFYVPAWIWSAGFFMMGCLILFARASDDPREIRLIEEQKELAPSPGKDDPIAAAVVEALRGTDSSVEAHSTQSGNKVLLLIKLQRLHLLSPSARKDLKPKIMAALSGQHSAGELYVGIRDNNGYGLVYAPGTEGGTLADLLNYFGPPSKK